MTHRRHHRCPMCGSRKTWEDVEYLSKGSIRRLYCANDKCRYLIDSWMEKILPKDLTTEK